MLESVLLLGNDIDQRKGVQADNDKMADVGYQECGVAHKVHLSNEGK